LTAGRRGDRRCNASRQAATKAWVKEGRAVAGEGGVKGRRHAPKAHVAAPHALSASQLLHHSSARTSLYAAPSLNIGARVLHRHARIASAAYLLPRAARTLPCCGLSHRSHAFRHCRHRDARISMALLRLASSRGCCICYLLLMAIAEHRASLIWRIPRARRACARQTMKNSGKSIYFMAAKRRQAIGLNLRNAAWRDMRNRRWRR